jgi:hypothetical protein
MTSGGSRSPRTGDATRHACTRADGGDAGPPHIPHFVRPQERMGAAPQPYLHGHGGPAWRRVPATPARAGAASDACGVPSPRGHGVTRAAQPRLAGDAAGVARNLAFFITLVSCRRSSRSPCSPAAHLKAIVGRALSKKGSCRTTKGTLGRMLFLHYILDYI